MPSSGEIRRKIRIISYLPNDIESIASGGLALND